MLGIEERELRVEAGADGAMGPGGAAAEGGAGGQAGGQASCDASELCAPPAPAGWEGPVAVTLGTSESIACDAAWPEQLLLAGVGTPGGELTCDDCACEQAVGESCPASAVVRTFGDDATCTNEVGAFTFVTGCTSATLSNHYIADPVVPTGGSCNASGGDVIAVPAMFAQWARVCSAAGSRARCVDGGTCAPQPAGGPDTALCIRHEGALEVCPPGPYASQPLVVVAEFDDARTCTACACSDPSGGACDGAVTRVYNGGTCTGTSGFVQHPTPCASFSSNVFARGSLDMSGVDLVPGSCTPSGGTPEGEVTVEAWVTLCCLE